MHLALRTLQVCCAFVAYHLSIPHSAFVAHSVHIAYSANVVLLLAHPASVLRTPSICCAYFCVAHSAYIANPANLLRTLPIVCAMLIKHYILRYPSAYITQTRQVLCALHTPHLLRSSEFLDADFLGAEFLVRSVWCGVSGCGVCATWRERLFASAYLYLLT
jgi:hypothetical protein